MANEIPAEAPATMRKVDRTIKKQVYVPRIEFKFCPKCNRDTYIKATDDHAAPFNRVGCFVESCKYVIPDQEQAQA